MLNMTALTKAKGADREVVVAATVVEERRGATHRDRSHLVGVARIHTLGGFVTKKLQSLLLHQPAERSECLRYDD